MQTAEIELKFPVLDLADLEARLPGLGFHLVTARTFEQNTLYDTPERTLRAAKQILRIRQYGETWTLTHKRPADPATDSDSTRYGDPSSYKVRIETETRVEDGPTLGAVFARLGYCPVFRYEKFRTEWSYSTRTIDGPLFADRDRPGEVYAVAPHGHLVIDETPIGDYAELEGPPAWIDHTLAQLGVDSASCLTDSYGTLFLDWKQRTASAAENLTFDEIASSEALQSVAG
jgi:adenylate cyclase class 2